MRNFRIFSDYSFLKKTKEYIYVFVEKHSTSPPCGNLVDGLPHDCHTETIAKPARPGPAENGKPMENVIELSMFCIIFDKKTPRISCPEYIEDLDKCIKKLKRQCQCQIHRVPLHREFLKNGEIFEKYKIFSFSRNFLL